MVRAVLFAAALIAISQAPQSGANVVVHHTLPSGKVTMMLPAEGLPRRPDLGQAAVATETVKVAQTRDLPGLLEARGVQPTPEAIGVIYDLNPTVDDIRTIRPGAALVLPKVTGGAALDAAIAKGYRARLSTDATSISAVTMSSATLRQLTERVTLVRVERFRNPADRERLISSFASGTKLVDRTLTGRFPLAQKVLTQTAINAGIMKASAEAALGPGDVEASGPSAEAAMRQVESGTVDQLEQATQGQQSIVTDLEAGGSALGLVEVQTVDNAGKARPLLRVTYAPKLDPTAVSSFRGLTSPSIETLVVGADFTLSAPGADKPVTIRVEKKNQPIVLKIINP